MFCHHSDIWPGAANGKQIWELQGPKQEIGNYKYKHTYKDKKYKYKYENKYLARWG